MAMSSAPPTALTARRCRRMKPIARRHPAEAERHEDERDAQPQAVAGHQERAAPGAALGERQRVHRGERRGEARRPGHAEPDAEQRRADQPRLRQFVDLELALQEADPAEEHDAEHDRDRAEHPLDRRRGASGCRRRARRTPRPAPRARRVKPSTNSSAPNTIRRWLGFSRVAGHPGHVGEIARDERQHARRDEPDHADEGGDARRDEERPVGDRVREAAVGQHGQCSASSVCSGAARSFEVSLPEVHRGDPSAPVDQHGERQAAAGCCPAAAATRPAGRRAPGRSSCTRATLVLAPLLVSLVSTPRKSTPLPCIGR